MNTKERKNEKGITILALVITVIVILILAGITIGTISGDDGAIINASKAKFRTEIRDIQEKIELEEINHNDGEDFQFGSLEDLIGRTDEYNISNLYINDSSTSRGMFLNNKGTIENLRIIVEAYVGAYSGIICGTNEGKIQNVRIDGKIESISTSAGGSWLGSICYNNTGEIIKGYNYAEIKGMMGYIGGICSQNNGTIKQCKNEGKIWNTNSVVGGIVGINYQNVGECINKGDISTNFNYSFIEGGMIGRNYGKISDSYNLGNLGTVNLQERYIGGIIGANGENGEVVNCYSTAEIIGAYLGGIVSTNSGKVTNCWFVKKGNYDIQLSTSTGIIESSGEKTEDEMKESAFLDVLNAGNEETIWKIDSRKNNGYPYLTWEDE